MNPLLRLLCLFAATTVLTLDPHILPAAEPRYIFFNIAPGAEWKQEDPTTANAALLTNVIQKIDAPPNPDLRLGVSLIFSVLEHPPELLSKSLRAMLAASKSSDVPILIALDGQNWWQNRPDLWNWWDPRMPGYNTENARNVEWTSWDSSSAVKISWRNWGSQIRIAPAQNIASPIVVEEVQKAFHALIPILMEWYGGLPLEKQYLFGGLKLGWETSIGYNAFYYPDGNKFLEQWPSDPSHDPQTGLDHSKGISGGLQQLGYAAVRTAKIKASGELARQDLAELTRQYLQMLSRTASELGVPTHLIYAHQGGNFPPWELNMPFWPAVNGWSNPGWSFYGTQPVDMKGLADEMDRTSRIRWAAAEWWWGARDVAGWEAHFEQTLRWRDCRFVCVYNWNQNGFLAEPNGLQAVRNLARRWKDENR